MKTKKDIASSQKRNQSDLRLRIGLFIALHILFAFSSTLNSIDRIEEEHNFEAHYQKSKTTLEGIEGFGDPTFNRIIDIHDQYLSEFGKWRGLFSRYAGELAKLVKTFPGSQRLSEDELRQNFSDPYSNYGNFASNGVFEPWTNRWSGKWSNGKMQYHIWDTTQFFNARMVQAVTLSESRFVHIDKAGKIAQSGKADIAVNILSAEAGIT
nr:hypothetical protein [Fodinibius sp.]NIV10651.1 hypothetical protein [Fodinibius sp.]NIY24267.1 hypothetical protein [Fodinibius sp.]